MVGRLIVLGSVLAALVGAAPARAAMSCPAGLASQTLTVVNQAKVKPRALAAVERAVSAQTLQLSAAWGTPCARFGAGGWKVYLKIGGAEPHGEHDFYGQPYALVWTSGASVEGWSRDFSHEVIEMLEDPTLEVRYEHAGSTWQREIADPVEGLGYRLDGVYVSDFVTPLWYAGASTGADVVCQGVACADDSPLIAPAVNVGPWDQMHALTAAWAVFGPRTMLPADS
ncbi:MAG: hypothetical protein JO130_15280 [Solirubrobacterales bacterium]|nr:hypothetical protein [Solirubrobacterales bacterium]